MAITQKETKAVENKGEREMEQYFFPADGERPAITILARSREEAEEQYKKPVVGRVETKENTQTL